MIDKDLDPSLIEVNHLPSWGTDSPIDEDIKSRVITQALSAIKVNAQDRNLYETAKRKQSRVRLRNQSTMASADDIVIDDQGQAKSNGCASRKRPPTLFDSNSAERRIRAVYEKHAPEKLDKVKNLLNRYRGYEEWLVKKVEDKTSTMEATTIHPAARAQKKKMMIGRMVTLHSVSVKVNGETTRIGRANTKGLRLRSNISTTERRTDKFIAVWRNGEVRHRNGQQATKAAHVSPAIDASY